MTSRLCRQGNGERKILLLSVNNRTPPVMLPSTTDFLRRRFFSHSRLFSPDAAPNPAERRTYGTHIYTVCIHSYPGAVLTFPGQCKMYDAQHPVCACTFSRFFLASLCKSSLSCIMNSSFTQAQLQLTADCLLPCLAGKPLLFLFSSFKRVMHFFGLVICTPRTRRPGTLKEFFFEKKAYLKKK